MGFTCVWLFFNKQINKFKKYDGQELQIKNNNVFNLNLIYSKLLSKSYVNK